jgi:hypothetical protein
VPFGTVAATNVGVAFAVPLTTRDLPRVATDFAVPDQRAMHVGLDVDLALFAAVGADDVEFGVAHWRD